MLGAAPVALLAAGIGYIVGIEAGAAAIRAKAAVAAGGGGGGSSRGGGAR
jgi:hypothetical protein